MVIFLLLSIMIGCCLGVPIAGVGWILADKEEARKCRNLMIWLALMEGVCALMLILIANSGA